MTQPVAPNAATLKVAHLFHYQKFNADWLRMAVLDEKIYFSNPNNFNDPWDCQPSYYIPTENEREIRESYIAKFTANESDGDSAAKLRRDKKYLESVIEKFSNLMRDAIHKQYRVYCLSTHAESTLMWSHYADNHRGVCLDFKCDNEVFGGAMRVNYIDKYPLIDFTCDPLLPLITKACAWSYEDEYRVVALEKFIDPSVALSGMIRTKENFLKLPHGALQSVIMGCLIEKDKADQLQQIIGEQCPRRVAVRRAVRIPNKYSLSIEKC
jgi:hypothetical protein